MIDRISKRKLDALPYPNIRKVADLTYLDGPLLSLFRDFEDQNYIYYWCDSDEMCNRWLVFRVTANQFELYIKQNLTLYKLILNAVDSEMYIVDIDGNGNQISIVLTQPEELPKDYLPQGNIRYMPDTTIFYESQVCSEIITILHDEIRKLRPELNYLKYTQRVSPTPLSQEKSSTWLDFNNFTSKYEMNYPSNPVIPKLRPYGRRQQVKQ